MSTFRDEGASRGDDESWQRAKFLRRGVETIGMPPMKLLVCGFVGGWSLEYL